MKACQYCHNPFEDDQVADHEVHCAKNPTVTEAQRKAGALESYVKTATLDPDSGKIQRVYWAHSTGQQDFTEELPLIMERWSELYPDEDYHSYAFLRRQGFKVIWAAG